MSHISYAVIALKRSQVNAVVARLQADGRKSIADWLDARKDALYGPHTEDWRPFGGLTVGELLNPGGEDVYSSETHLIDALNRELSNTAILVRSGIEVFFIDVFALFSDWHRALAGKLDIALSEKGKCCLVMPYGLSTDCEHFFTTYNAVCNGVVGAYVQGFFHPLVLRADDLTHLRNYLLTIPRPGESPDREKARAVDEMYGAGTKPQLGLGR